MSPFFSVVIPLFNKENYIQETINSVLKQTFKDFELIIINDGSTDSSLTKAEVIKDKRIKIFSIKNSGLSAARNFGIKKSKANYFCFIDADDHWYSHHLKQLFDLINSFPNKGLYCSGYAHQKSPNIVHRAQFYNVNENFRGVISNFFENSLQHCVAWISAVCIPKNIFEDIGCFDTKIFSVQDTDLYVRIALKYEVVLDNTSVSAIYNRTAENSLSNLSYFKKYPKLFDKYKSKEVTNKSLKKFMDYNRFSFIILSKIYTKSNIIKKHIKDIDLNNLTLWQRILLILPIKLIRLIYFMKRKFYLKSSFVYKPKFKKII